MSGTTLKAKATPGLQGDRRADGRHIRHGGQEICTMFLLEQAAGEFVEGILPRQDVVQDLVAVWEGLQNQVSVKCEGEDYEQPGQLYDRVPLVKSRTQETATPLQGKQKTVSAKLDCEIALDLF
eukprot:6491912-Amphidinium_carterae.2